MKIELEVGKQPVRGSTVAKSLVFLMWSAVA